MTPQFIRLIYYAIKLIRTLHIPLILRNHVQNINDCKFKITSSTNVTKQQYRTGNNKQNQKQSHQRGKDTIDHPPTIYNQLLNLI